MATPESPKRQTKVSISTSHVEITEQPLSPRQSDGGSPKRADRQSVAFRGSQSEPQPHTPALAGQPLPTKSKTGGLWQKANKGAISCGVFTKSTHDVTPSDDIRIAYSVSCIPMLARVSSELISKLSHGLRARTYKTGDIIFEEKTEGASLLVVMSGEVDVVIDGQKVDTMTSKQYFGETNLLGLESEWAASLVCKTRCETFEITRTHWLSSLQEFPTDKHHFEAMKSTYEGSTDCGMLTNSCNIFHGLATTTLNAIGCALVNRLYFPGQKLLEAGGFGDEIHIMLHGHANVEIAGRCVRSELVMSKQAGQEEHGWERFHSQATGRASIHEDDSHNVDSVEDHISSSTVVFRSPDPICYGELGFLGSHHQRSKDVVAQTVCQVRILHRINFLKILQEHDESVRLAEMAQMSDMPNVRELSKVGLRQFKFFEQSCSDKFLDFLSDHLELRVFLFGQNVAPEPNCLYILSKGSLHQLKDDQLKDDALVMYGPKPLVQTCGEGKVLGEIEVLGLGVKEPTMTYDAVGVCFIQVLHQSTIIRALELFPDERYRILLMQFKISETDQDEDFDRDHHHRHRSSRKSMADTSRKSVGKSLAVGKRQRESTISSLSYLNVQRASMDQSKLDLGKEEFYRKSRKAFLHAMHSSPCFANVGVAFIEHLSNVSADRIYMPGDIVMEEGRRGDSMFIMVSGTASVFVRSADSAANSHNQQQQIIDISGAGQRFSTVKALKRSSLPTSRVGFLTSGSISGELGMLGIYQYRSATIEAESLCSMWEITQENALSALSSFPEAKQHFSNIVLSRLDSTAPMRVVNLPLFDNFEKKFRMLVGLYCEKRAYFPGQNIVREGHNCDGMYILNTGNATLEKARSALKMYAQGSHFCSTVMLGIHKKPLGTVIAHRTCHCLVVTHASFGLAAEKYPDWSHYEELKRTEMEEYERLRLSIDRVAARRKVMSRMNTCLDEKKLSDEALLKKIMKVWKILACEQGSKRRRLQAQKERTDEWILKKKEALRNRNMQVSEQHDVQHASDRRHLGQLDHSRATSRAHSCSNSRSPSPSPRDGGENSNSPSPCHAGEHGPSQRPHEQPPEEVRKADFVRLPKLVSYKPGEPLPPSPFIAPPNAKRQGKKGRPHCKATKRIPASNMNLGGDASSASDCVSESKSASMATQLEKQLSSRAGIDGALSSYAIVEDMALGCPDQTANFSYPYPPAGSPRQHRGLNHKLLRVTGDCDGGTHIFCGFGL